MTQARLGEINTFAKPFSSQLAYNGYAKAIEAFIFATCVGRKVTTTQKHYPLPEDYVPTVPLSLPRTVIRLRDSKPSQIFLSSFDAAMKKLDGSKKELGKGNLVYIINKPTFTSIRGNLHRVADITIPYIDHCSSIYATHCATTILQFIDLFLRTQTYEYKGEDLSAYNDEEKASVYIKRPFDHITYEAEGMIRKRQKGTITKRDIRLKLIS